MEARKVIIVGASSGIGRALAIRYAKQGCALGITGRRTELLEKLREEIASFTPHSENGEAVFIESFDTMGKDNIFHMHSLLNKLGGLDLLIYNSGYGEVTERLEWEVDKKIVDTNVNGFLEIVNWAFNYFHEQDKGQIAATSSIASNRGSSYAPAYSASKAFMSNYMEGLYLKAKKLKTRIYITDIQPGFVDTKMAKGNKRFWVVSLEKAASQIFNAIENKRFRVYVSRRWWLIAKLMKLVPLSIYRQFG
jgi:short-subunit dehydrogenase